ncbi:hypothetical protein TNCV_1967931 [Trichonephila clavipes]|nr:hypothetical protein TNCV_1967931 [Trichonephila clavipes]
MLRACRSTLNSLKWNLEEIERQKERPKWLLLADEVIRTLNIQFTFHPRLNKDDLVGTKKNRSRDRVDHNYPQNEKILFQGILVAPNVQGRC